MREADDISTAPGQDDRRHGTNADATGHGLQAQSDVMEQAPEGAGRPGKVSPRSLGRCPDMGRDDAASPARLSAKDRHPRVRALIRRYEGRVQEG